MTDEKLLDSIRQSAENIPIPDGIAPQAMEENLKKAKKQSFSSIYKIAGAAAAVLCLVIGIWAGTTLSRSGQSDSAGTAGNDGMNIASFATQSPAPDAAESPRPTETPGPAVTPGPALPSGNAIRLAGFSPQDSYEALYDTLSEISIAKNVDSSWDDDPQIYDGDNVSGGSQGTDYSATNVQTAGVEEGDLVKTNGAQICVLRSDSDGTTIKVIDAASMELISTISVTRDPNVQVMDEMYLDDTSLTVFATGFVTDLIRYTDDACDVQADSYTAAYVYNISDPSNITLEGQVGQSGSYMDSRKNGDNVYLFTDNHVMVPSVRDLYEQYIPSVNGTYLPADHIYIPDRGSTMNYLQVTSFNVKDPANIIDSKAIFSGADIFYVSSDHIYIANYGDIHDSQSAESSSGGIRYLAENSDSSREQAENSGNSQDQASTMQHGDFRTQIVSIAYENGSLAPQAAGTVDGYLNNSFSMDAFNGYLRLVTTRKDNTAEPMVGNAAASRSNCLYILDADMNLTGAVEDLAPGETIRSARFLGDVGCFVTYRNIDPLFSVDLSDPYNPVVLGQLQLTGFSEYLHFYKEDRLLGIGMETDPDTGRTLGVKLSMFDISDPANVTELHRYVIDHDTWGNFQNHRAILADPEKNLIGFAGKRNYENYEDVEEGSATSGYRLFTYDDTEGFRLLLDYNLEAENDTHSYYDYTYYDMTPIDNARGLYIGDTFYVSSDVQLTGFDMKNGFAQKGYVKY